MKIYNFLKNMELPKNSNQGYVYILYNKSNNLCKIGITKNPKRRLSQLCNQNGAKLDYIISKPSYIYKTVEKLLHMELNKYKTYGEWYNCEIDICINYLNYIMNSDDYKRINEMKSR